MPSKTSVAGTRIERSSEWSSVRIAIATQLQRPKGPIDAAAVGVTILVVVVVRLLVMRAMEVAGAGGSFPREGSKTHHERDK